MSKMPFYFSKGNNMNKFKSAFLLLTLVLCGMSSAYAKNVPFTIDYSNVILEVGQTVDWTYYNLWYLGNEEYVPGAMNPGWTGEPLEELTKGPYIVKNGGASDSNYIQILNIGLTNNAGGSFTPAPTPESCAVNLKSHDVLHVNGILHIPGNDKEPYIDNLSCTVSRGTN
jgi:hypothetical protein